MKDKKDIIDLFEKKYEEETTSGDIAKVDKPLGKPKKRTDETEKDDEDLNEASKEFRKAEGFIGQAVDLFVDEIDSIVKNIEDSAERKSFFKSLFKTLDKKTKGYK